MNMRPSFTKLNFRNSALINTKLFSKFFLLVCCIKFYFSNLLLGKFMVKVLNSIKSDTFVSSFTNHIISIIMFSSNKQMVWPYTWTIIASVKNTLFIGREITMKEFPRHLSSTDWKLSIHPKMPVTSTVQTCFPYPTRAKFWTMWRNRTIFINFRPKALFYWNWFGTSFHTINNNTYLSKGQVII